MRKLRLLMCVFCFVVYHTIVFGQPGPIDGKIDSLLNILKKQKDDTSKVNTLNMLSQQFLLTSKTDEAKKYANEALSLSRKISFKRGEALSHNNLGRINLRAYNFTEAMQSFKTYLKLAEDIYDNSLIPYAFFGIAQTYHQQGKYPEAIQHHFAALRLFKEMDNKPSIIMIYLNLGWVYWHQGYYSNAYLNFNAALNIATEIKDYKDIAISRFMLGNVYYDDGNYPEAIKQWLSSLAVYTKNNDSQGVADCNNNIAAIYQKQKKFDKALIHLEAALKVYEQDKNNHRTALVVNNIAEVYKDQGNYSKAFDKFNLFLSISREIKNKGFIALAHQNLGNLNYTQAENESNAQIKEELLKEALKLTQEGLNDFNILNQKQDIAKSYILIGLINIESRKFPDARIILNEALILSRETGVKELVRDTYQALTKLDSLVGNWKEAFRNNNLYLSYRDSLINKENTEKILRLQLQYDFDKKEDSLNYQQSLTVEKLKQQILLADQQEQTLLLNEKEFALITNEKKLTQLQIEKSLADYAVQKTEADKRQEQLTVLNKEKEIQSLELKKQKLAKNYFIAGLILFALVSFFIYRHYRTRQQLRLQTLRNKIASDLHDDIGSTLSSISIFSQMAQQQSKDVVPMLETIGENSRKMLDAMADIVWTINPENDQFEKIVLRMRSFAFELLGAKNIDFEFNADEEVTKMKLSMDVRKNLYLIFKEATNNLAKYSGANKAAFRIKTEKNNLSMMISDNGKGFDQMQATAGNGLKNMKKRAEEIGAQFMIRSNPENGTIIELKVAV